jgi:hypothetical protein
VRKRSEGKAKRVTGGKTLDRLDGPAQAKTRRRDNKQRVKKTGRFRKEGPRKKPTFDKKGSFKWRGMVTETPHSTAQGLLF